MYNDLLVVELTGFPVKAVLMFSVLYLVKEDPILTIGDAISSFLEHRDSTTGKVSLFSLRDCKNAHDSIPRLWNNTQFRWGSTVSKIWRGTIIVV